MAIILSEAAHDENGQLGYEAHQKGDQLTGNGGYNQEVRFISYYNKPWTYVFRPKDKNCANAIAIRMQQVVNNKNVGYGQPARADIYTQLTKDPDPSHISVKIDCDCSSLVNTVVYVTYKSIGIANCGVSGLETTGAMPSKYMSATGQKHFENVTSKINLTTGEGLQVGDILVRPNSHTAIVTSVSSNVASTPTPTTTKKVGTVTTSLYCRSGAGGNYSIKGILAANQKVTIVDEITASNGGKWYKIEYNGGYGYCAAKYVTV